MQRKYFNCIFEVGRVCLHAHNTPLTPGWRKCICRVFIAGYQVSGRPAVILTSTQESYVCERLWQWLLWTQQQREEHLRARGKHPDGGRVTCCLLLRPRGRKLLFRTETHQPQPVFFNLLPIFHTGGDGKHRNLLLFTNQQKLPLSSAGAGLT